MKSHVEIEGSGRVRGREGGRRVGGAAALLSLVLAIGCAPGPDGSGGLSEGDRERARAVERAYVTGWEANDSAAVMATLTPDAVLIPDRMAPIRGDSAIRAYWWPADGSATRVTSYETRVDEVGGSGAVAYLRGAGELEFDWRPHPDSSWSSFSSASAWLSLLRRGTDGTWAISHRMWHRAGSP